MLTVEGQFHKYAPPYKEGEVLTLPNSTPRRIKILLLGPEGDSVGNPIDPVKWWGLAGDEVRFHPGTVFEPILSEGEDPMGGAFRYRYAVSVHGVLDFKVK